MGGNGDEIKRACRLERSLRALSSHDHTPEINSRRHILFSNFAFSFLFCAEWQIYVLLIGLFLASAAAFYIFFENSDSFWNFPLGKNQPRPKLGSFIRDQKSSDDQNMWSAFGPLDMWVVPRIRTRKPREVYDNLFVLTSLIRSFRVILNFFWDTAKILFIKERPPGKGL